MINCGTNMYATRHLSRRNLLRGAGIGMAGLASGMKMRGSPSATPLFDGKSLDGWLQIENSATLLSTSGMKNPTAFVLKLAKGSDAVSTFLRGKFEDGLKADLASYSETNVNSKPVLSTLVKEVNRVLGGPSIYEKARFQGVILRPKTAELLRSNPQSQHLARLNKLLLEDAYPQELQKSVVTGWVAKDGLMASTGSGRGVIYTASDYGHFRLSFTMRHVAGNPDHQACILIFCTRPQPGEKPLDALGGIQFQVPNGGHWDYRPGMNNNGGPEFMPVTKTHFDAHQWSRVEILADAAKGTARMAVAQPPGSQAVEVLDFKDSSAGKMGPVAWQMHNAGLLDEYKNVEIEPNPQDNNLLSVR